MAVKVGNAHLVVRRALPDIAHNTTAVAVAMYIQDENRHARESGSLQPGRRNAFLMQQGHDALSFRRQKNRFPESLRLVR
jgi:hypothetical protein